MCIVLFVVLYHYSFITFIILLISAMISPASFLVICGDFLAICVFFYFLNQSSCRCVCFLNLIREPDFYFIDIIIFLFLVPLTYALIFIISLLTIALVCFAFPFLDCWNGSLEYPFVIFPLFWDMHLLL